MSESNPTRSGLPVTVTGDPDADINARLPVFEVVIPMRWGDMDYQRHINNVMYFRYMEQARIAWIDAMDVRTYDANQGPVVINAYCSFLRELHYPGSVLARLSVGQFGNSSVMTFVDMCRTDEPDTIYASGGAKLVWIDLVGRKSVKIPHAVREKMSGPLLGT